MDGLWMEEMLDEEWMEEMVDEFLWMKTQSTGPSKLRLWGFTQRTTTSDGWMEGRVNGWMGGEPCTVK